MVIADMGTGKKAGRIKLSVIIPVYNTAKWLGECLDSVLSQETFDLEVICVDDGSTDESPEILREYSEKDSRIKIITQENQGLSAARNAGLKAAQGEYIWLLDSDDTINPDSLESIRQEIEKYGKPEVICFPDAHSFVDSDYQGARKGRKKRESPKSRLTGINTGAKTMQILLEEKRRWVVVWIYIIRRDFAEKNRLRFKESLRVHEDMPFVLQMLREAVSVICIPAAIVNHRIREGSNMDLLSKKVLLADVRMHFDSFMEAYRIYSGSERLKQDVPDFKYVLMERIRLCQNYYRKSIRNPENSEEAIIENDRKPLFDLLICYPVKTGKDLQALKNAKKKIASGPFGLYKIIIKPIRTIRRWMRIKG